jgi:micrococcal nuclease
MIVRILPFVGALAFSVIWAPAALADPCKAIPDKGPLPAYLHRGAKFSGQVAYIGDGDSYCVQVDRGPEGLVEIREADFYAPELHEPGGPEAKRTLEHIAKGEQATCVAGHRSYDRIVAICQIRGRSVGDLMRHAGIKEGGRAYRR